MSSIFLQHLKYRKVGSNWRARRDALRFFIHLSQMIKKLKGDTLKSLKYFRKKVPQCRKKLEGGTGPFSLTRYCMLRGKKEEPFWFSSLGQMVRFDNVEFRRTF